MTDDQQPFILTHTEFAGDNASGIQNASHNVRTHLEACGCKPEDIVFSTHRHGRMYFVVGTAFPNVSDEIAEQFTKVDTAARNILRNAQSVAGGS